MIIVSVHSVVSRYNLDPDNKCSDEEVYHALEISQLKDIVMADEKRLSKFIIPVIFILFIQQVCSIL